MSAEHEQSPDGALMTPHRLAEIVADIDRQDPLDRRALLAALTAAAWPTRSAREQ
jgi:hypothetical protein